MRISDAAVKGRELIDPRSGNDLYPPDEGERYAGCYRGMALVGAGAVQLPAHETPEIEDEGIDLVDVLTVTWPWVGTKAKFPCACKDKSSMGSDNVAIYDVLAHLWDLHGPPNEALGDTPHVKALNDPWTFERITEWVRSIEPPDQPADAPQA